MKFNQVLHVARQESFEIDHPEVSVLSITSEVTIVESRDGKSHVKILAESEKSKQLAESVEIVESHGKLTIRADKKSRNFWGLGDGGLHALSIELALPKTANVKVKTVSGDIEVNQTLSSLEIGSVSGDVLISQNPETTCIVKTVSGDIATHTFSACDYTLKSISGDIKVHVAPNLDIDVEGNSISGDLNSEISLNDASGESSSTNKVVRISTTTISGDFNLVRN